MKLPIAEDSAPQVVPVAYYVNDWWPGKNQKYTGQIVRNDQQMPKVIKEVCGKHLFKNTNKDVLGLRFDFCNMTFVPRGICTVYPNLQILLVYNSNVQKLKKDDFLGCEQLKELWLNSLNIEYLPGNLFHHMPNLEIVSVQSCKVKYIDNDILDHLKNLKVAKFNSNEQINAFYDSVSLKTSDGISLEELKQMFKKLSPPNYYDLSEYFEADKLDPVQPTNDYLADSVIADIKKFTENEKYKDLTVIVDGDDFKVHKFVMAARSSVFADMIYKNQQSTLELTDLRKEIFQDILIYIYSDELPEINNNAFDLFSAACRFDIDVLKKHAISKMTSGVTAENALDMLICGKLYGNESLKKNAFDEIKKMFPDRELSEELTEDTEKLKKIIDAKMVMDEKIRQAQEEFEQMGFFD
ncbi:hypothetical protein ACKWTF_014858 [Chironomus riparius]